MSWVKETRKIFRAARIFHTKDVAQFLVKDLLSILECYRKKKLYTISEILWTSEYNLLFQNTFTFETRSFLFE